jgi:inward rectifier potassium channel
LIYDEKTEGGTMRLFHDMKLVRSQNPVFALTWTIMHPIDDHSPLKPWLDHQSAPPANDIVVVVSGTDDRSGHTMYGRWAYGGEDLRWNARFADILGLGEDGMRTIDYRRFNDVVPIEAVER